MTAEPTPTVELTPTAEPTPTPETAPTSVPASATGLGLTRADAARVFQFLGFDFQLTQAAEYPDDYVGTVSDGLATVHIVGQVTRVSSVSLAVDVPKPPTESQSSRMMVYLVSVLIVAADDWTAGTEWLNEKLNVMGESRIVFDGREAVLLLTPTPDAMHIEFTIQALQ